jgi:uncharacterized delta-60 repeat protein
MRGLRRVILGASLFGLASLLAPIGQGPAQAGGYQLDSSFGGVGYVKFDAGNVDHHDPWSDLIVRDDGSVQFAGSAFTEGQPSWDHLVHLSPTGVVDPAFGGDGSYDLGFREYFIEARADGSFFIRRYTDSGWVITRYLRPDEVDTNFGTAGNVPFKFAGADPSPVVRAQPDGGGWFVVGTGSINPDFVVTKLTAAGAPDTTFGPDGTLSTDFGGTDEAITAAVQADGKLLVAGVAGPDGNRGMALVRYTDEGLDPSFSGDGRVTDLDFHMRPESISVQPDGKILVAGAGAEGSTLRRDVALARFLPDGSPDLAFGTAGIVETNLGGDEYGSDVAVAPDGHLFVAGRQLSNDVHRGAGIVARYRADGTPDPSFGTGGGLILTQFSTNQTLLSSVAVDGDRVYVAGRTSAGGYWVVARLRPIPEPPTSSSTSSTTTSSTTTTTRGTTVPTVPPVTNPTTPPDHHTAGARPSGYWMLGVDGTVYRFGDAGSYGNAAVGSAEAVDIERSPSGGGYWIVDNTGRVYPFGDARWFGNIDVSRLQAGERVTSLSARRSPEPGYLVFTSKGRVFAFGPEGRNERPGVGHLTLNGPVLDSVVTPSGDGYYMVASDGGIFTFGDAAFHGSMGDRRLNAPVQSLVPDGDGDGYWLVASDGGIFAFRAGFKGSMGATRLNRPVTGMVRAGTGYLMVGEDGGIFDFSGDPTSFKGSLGATPPARPITSVALL